MSVISLDERHTTLLAHRTGITGLNPGACAVRLGGVLICCHGVRHHTVSLLPDEGATESELGLAMTVGETAKVANFV